MNVTDASQNPTGFILATYTSRRCENVIIASVHVMFIFENEIMGKIIKWQHGQLRSKIYLVWYSDSRNSQVLMCKKECKLKHISQQPKTSASWTPWAEVVSVQKGEPSTTLEPKVQFLRNFTIIIL